MSQEMRRTGEPNAFEGGTDAAEKGFSLIEVVIASTILFTIILIAGGFVVSSNSMLGAMSSRAEADVKAAEIADRLAKLMRNAHSSSILPYPGGTPCIDGWQNTTIYFRLIKEFKGRAVLGDGYYIYPAVAPRETYGDGVDNDKDGRIDEVAFRLVKYNAATYATDDPANVLAFVNVASASDTSISDNLRYYNTIPSNPAQQYGLWFTRTGNTLRIQVTTVRYDPTTRMTLNVTAESSVKLRT